jgi:hypothetical protein
LNSINNIYRKAVKIIRESIITLDLDLANKVVLTEVGSANYCYIPLIPLLAGADKVYAWTRDSAYGKAQDIMSRCYDLAKELNCNTGLTISEVKNLDHVAEADIITNSGFIRPLDSTFLRSVKLDVAIPLMYEAWEIREDDIDISYCKENGIKVAGTWEDHPGLQVFKNVGPLCIKLCMEAGFEIFCNRIIVWSNDHFGEEAEKAFNALNAQNVIVTTEVAEVYKNAADTDFIFICDYDEKRNYFHGEDAVFSLERINKLNPTIGVVHLYGEINSEALRTNGITVYPDKEGRPLVMSETLSYLGMKPFIKLQVGGFKVGQELLEKRLTKLSQLISGAI